MAAWVVHPFESFGPLRFGASRGEVREALGGVPREFQKGEATNLVESYEDVGVHIYYDGDGGVEFVEAFPPCEPVFAAVELMARDPQLTIGQLFKTGIEPREDGQGGLWFDDYGFARYAPEGATGAVSVFRRGYDTGR